MIVCTLPDTAAWQHEAALFMDDHKEIDASHQLAFMGAVLGEFRQYVPRLSSAQRDVLSGAIEQHPDRRVIPTALRQVTDREVIVKPYDDDSLPAEIMRPHAKLWTPQENSDRTYPEPTTWHKLWSGSAKIEHDDALFIPKDQRDKGVKSQIRTYGLRYKTAEGRMMSRPQYIASLLHNGDAVRAEDGTVWTFPLMDVSRTSPDKKDKGPEDLYKRLHHIISPEARLGVQVLHLIAGNPLHPDVVEITNETLSELKPGGSYRETRGVVGVTRSAVDQFFRFSWWTMYALPDWQLPQGTSGLQKASQQPTVP